MRNPTLIALHHKLQQWELRHLRTHAANLAVQLEQANAEITLLRDRLQWAEDCAAHWQCLNMDLLDEIHATAPDATIGITQDGDIAIVTANDSPERKAA